MENLISKLSKIDQRNVRMALIHANNGNMRPLEFMLRASNTRSEKIIKAIIDSVK